MELSTLFNQRLADTVTWCTAHASVERPATSLRSPELNPVAPRTEIQAGDMWEGAGGLVESLVAMRSRQLRKMQLEPTLPAAHLADGQLLVYFPYLNLTDGTAAEVSLGFLDGVDAPPWDTWVWFGFDATRWEYGGDVSDACYLVAWIPQAFVALVDAGRRVTITDCVVWLSDVPGLNVPVPG
jgi:hypothetical protein